MSWHQHSLSVHSLDLVSKEEPGYTEQVVVRADCGDEADVVDVMRISGGEQREPTGEAEADHADGTATDLAMQRLRCQADGRDGSRRDAKIRQLFCWRSENRYATCGERSREAD